MPRAARPVPGSRDPKRCDALRGSRCQPQSSLPDRPRRLRHRRAQGELGIASAPALRERLLSLLRAASQLIIDLSAVEHADASGLAVLVGSRRRARLLGGSLRLAAPSPEVTRVLTATGMNQHLDIFPTVRAAITGQPRLPEVILPPATVPARGRIDGVPAGGATQSAIPAIDLFLPLTERPPGQARA